MSIPAAGWTAPRVLGTAEAHVWELEMAARPERPRAVPPGPGVRVVEAKRITVSFYRYLYDTVGAEWGWSNRRIVDDAELSRRIHARGVEVHVLWVDGVPAGYAELDAGILPDVWVAYFGLIPEFVGRGLGRFFLDWTVDRAWDFNPERVRVSTCDFDHPAALPNYQRAGFRIHIEKVERLSVIPGVGFRRRDGSPVSITSPS
ncbi:MAG: GNAT family N-acetyltransferase [Geminicoccaceae bacterium]